MNTQHLVETVKELTIPCRDNRSLFTETQRIDYIDKALRSSCYVLIANSPPLARIYKHSRFSENRPFILISCHIDSVYGRHWCESRGAELLGTLDNSACNGVLLYCMINDLLSPQIVISFTGNEEDDSIGVDQTVTYLRDNGLWDALEMVVTLDLTEEEFGHPFTLENLFVKHNHGPDSALKFDRKKDLKDYIRSIVGMCTVIMNGDPDESWQYGEYDLNAFSYCLPCRLLAGDMHDDRGVAVEIEALGKYAETLIMLTDAIGKSIERQMPARPCTAGTASKPADIGKHEQRGKLGFRQFLQHLVPIHPDEREEWQDVLAEYDEEFGAGQPNLFWYPSSGFDLRALVHFNEKDTSEVYGSPTVDFFVYSDYSIFFHSDMRRYYDLLDHGQVRLFRDFRTAIYLEQMIPLTLMSDQTAARINAEYKLTKRKVVASNIAYYCMISIRSNYFGEEYFPLLYIPMDNWVLMETFWKPYDVRFQYICGVCDGCETGYARIGSDNRAMCVNRYYKDFLSVMQQGGFWVSDHIHRDLPDGFRKIFTFKGWGPYNENRESYLYQVEIDNV